MSDLSSFWYSGLGQVVLIFGIAIPLTAIIMGLQYRWQRKQLKKNPALVRDMEIQKEIGKNLPKFWTLPVVLGMLLGLAIVVFGVAFFWTVPGPPPSAFWPGLGLFVLGMIVISIAFLIGIHPRNKEYYRRWREAHGEV